VGLNDLQNFRIIVVGGSLGGLLAGNMLLRAGYDVTVHERIGEELAGRGVGVATHPELFNAFARAGVDANQALGNAVDDRIVLARDGTIAARHRVMQTMCSWGDLFALLRDAFPAERYFSGMTFERAEQDSESVRAHFSDGTVIDADILVGADGIHSTLRRQHWPDCHPQYAGYIAWRGVVPETRVSFETHDMLFSRYAFCLPPGEHMLGYPIAGANGDLRPGHRRYNLVWYRPANEAAELKRLLTDETGTYHPMGIPPGLIRAEAIAEMRAVAREKIAPQLREIVELIETPFLQSVVDMNSDSVVSGRVIILGDAAFLARPHLGMGVTKASGDALLLTELLSTFPGDITHALRVFDAERCRYGRYLTHHARLLGSQMKQTYTSEAERQVAEFYRNPETCLRKISLPPDPP
tara:strand:- start:922 stop:2154 length:1233 start_codon:yes stop_codon:yes gene_type:complete